MGLNTSKIRSLGNLKGFLSSDINLFYFPAPKTYSLSNTAQIDTGGNVDKSVLKVWTLIKLQLLLFLTSF